jgi:CubicO group peptidase (beta-lactamase class C family)
VTTVGPVTADVLAQAVHPFVEAGAIPGAVVGTWRGGDVSLAAVGTTALGETTAITTDTPLRVSSLTKPVVAALALGMVEDGQLALDDPVERFVPELADRRVLRRLSGPLGDTVPAARSVTVADLLTMRLGFGFAFEDDCPAVTAAAQAGLGIGPPDPSVPLDPDEWVARFAELPLLEQPGTVWRYDLAYAVLGVTLARAGGRALEELLRARLLDPLGMTGTSFVAEPGRLPPCYALGAEGLELFDGSQDSRWSRPPAFPDARGGLVSTASDLLRFAGSLLTGGGDVLTPRSVAAMTTNHLTDEQCRGPSATTFLDGLGWGHGVQVADAGLNPSVRVPRYGWGGGLGTLWYSWPEQGYAAVLLTQVMPPTAELVRAFLDAGERAATGDQGGGSAAPSARARPAGDAPR